MSKSAIEFDKLHVKGDYLNGGDKVGGDQFNDCNITINNKITVDGLVDISESILQEVLSANYTKATKRLNIIKELPVIDQTAKQVLDALEIAINVTLTNEAVKQHDLLTLIKNSNLPERLKDVIFAVLLIVASHDGTSPDTKALYDKSPKQRYSKLVYLQYIADKTELDNFWQQNKILADSQEIYALTLGSCRIDDKNKALVYATKLKQQSPSDKNLSLYLFIQATTLAYEHQGQNFYSLNKATHEQILSCANDVVNRIEFSSGDSYLLQALGNLISITQYSYPPLIDCALKHKDKFASAHPSAHSFLNNLSTSVPVDLAKQIRAIDSTIELSLENLKLLSQAQIEGLYLRNDIKTQVLRFELESGTDPVFSFNLIFLQAKLLLENNDIISYKLTLKKNIQTLEKLSSKEERIWTSDALIELSNYLLQLDCAQECCRLLKPYLPQKIWISPLTKTYFSALLQSEQGATVASYINRIDESLWDAYIWTIKARISTAEQKWNEAKSALENAIEKAPSEPSIWELLIRVTAEESPEELKFILAKIPQETFSTFDNQTFSLLSTVSRFINYHYSQRILTELFISEPTAYAPYLVNHHFSFLSGPFAQQASELNPYPLNSVARAILLEHDGETHETLLADIDPSKAMGALISVNTEYGDLLSEISVGEDIYHGMNKLKIIKELDPYSVALKAALDIAAKHPHHAFPMKQLKVPSDPNQLMEELHIQMENMNRFDNKSQIISSRLPLYVKGPLIDEINPVMSAIQLFGNPEANSSFSWVVGEVIKPKEFVTDIYGLIYLALTRADIALVNNGTKLHITPETNSSIKRWLNDVEREDYLTIGLNEQGLYKTVAADIQNLTASIREGLKTLLELATINPIPIQDTPTELIAIREFLDISTYSTMKYANFTRTPYLILDNLFKEYLNLLEEKILIFDAAKYLSSLNKSVPIEYKAESYQHHLINDFPVLIYYTDIMDLTKSGTVSNISIASKIIQRYSKSFDSFETAFTVLRKTLLQPLITEYNHNNFANENYSELPALFNACCQAIIDTSNGRSAEERLVKFTQSLIAGQKLPQAYINFVYSMTNMFISGHFLDYKYMNDLKNR